MEMEEGEAVAAAGGWSHLNFFRSVPVVLVL
jgi:hypothetical protein